MIYVVLDRSHCACHSDSTTYSLFYTLFPLVAYALLGCFALYATSNDNCCVSYSVPRPRLAVSLGFY